MKLHDIPKGSKIFGYIEGNEGRFLIFHHLDGMYSYCTSEHGSVVHLSAVTPLDKVEDGYIIAKD